MSAIVGIKEAREVAERYGFRIAVVLGDYRVSLKSNPSEAAAYYTSDLQDAVDTGIAMVANNIRIKS